MPSPSFSSGSGERRRLERRRLEWTVEKYFAGSATDLSWGRTGMTHAQIDFLILVQAWLDGSPQTEDKLVEVLMPNRKLLVGGRVVSVYSSVAPSLDVMCRISLRRSNPPSMILELQKSVADINCESVLHFFEQTHGVRIAEVAQEGDPIIEALSDASGRRVHFCFSSAQKSHERMLRWLTCIRPAASLA